jgi:hypothetical protein
MTTTTHPVPDLVRKMPPRAFLAGGLGLAVGIVGAFQNPTAFFRSYLLAFLFWCGIGVGCLSLLFIQHLTGGRWGLLIRRLLEAGARTLPYMAIGFIPILVAVPRLYAWGNPDVVAGDAILQHKRLYLNPGFFAARGLFYFLVWSSVAYFVSLWSARLDVTPDRLRLERRLRGLAGGGLLLLGLTITFSSIDWAMSLEAHWFSTIYGVLFMVGQVLSAFTLVILLVSAMGEEDPFRRVLDRDTVHDLGKLLFAFVMLWAYVNLSQFLIVWSANLPEETPWYVRRTRGGWQYLALVIIVTHFVAPFLALLSRALKRNLRRLAAIAAVVFAARLLDLYWLVAPSFGPGHVAFVWMDVALAAGLGGIWLGLFSRELAVRSLVPLGDSDLPVKAHA